MVGGCCLPFDVCCLWLFVGCSACHYCFFCCSCIVDIGFDFIVVVVVVAVVLS